jgi:hypothetical protein
MIKRTFRITCIAIIIVFAAIWNGLRLGETIFFWKTLEKYGAHPLYISISGGLWLLVGLVLFEGLWLGKAWVLVASLGGIVGYTAWYWFDRLVMQVPHANWPFVLTATLVFMLIILIVLLSHKSKLFL